MGLGLGETILILFIAYAVVGPEDMGKIVKTLAKVLRDLRMISADLRKEAKIDAIIPDIFLGEKDRNGRVTPVKEEGMESVPREIQKAEEKISCGGGKHD